MSIYGFLEHSLHIPWVFQAAVLAVAVLLLAGAVMRRQLAAAGGGQLPDEGITLRNVMEVIVEGLANMARDLMGEDWRKYVPLVVTLFATDDH